MNREACESFINFCDEMMIENEAKTNIPIDRKQAAKVSSMNELIAKGSAGTPLMVATGSMGAVIANAVNEKKDRRKWGTASIVLGLTILWPLLIVGIVQRSQDSGYSWVKNYKVIAGSENYYIIKKGYQLV